MLLIYLICTLINLLSQQSSCNHYFFRGNHIKIYYNSHQMILCRFF